MTKTTDAAWYKITTLPSTDRPSMYYAEIDKIVNVNIVAWVMAPTPGQAGYDVWVDTNVCPITETLKRKILTLNLRFGRGEGDVPKL